MSASRYSPAFDAILVGNEESPLDAGIARFVKILAGNGVETYESCEGGPGHCSPQPFVKFHGGPGAGPAALGVALTFGLPVAELQRVWSLIDGEPTGPTWVMTFRERTDGSRSTTYPLFPPVPPTEARC